MSFYRSDSVDRYTMYLPRQSSWNIMNILGQKDLLHIIPRKTVDIAGLPFTQQIKRCEEALQKVVSLEHILVQKKMEKPRYQYERLWDDMSKQNNQESSSVKINDIISQVDEMWDYYQELNKRIEALDTQVASYRENIAVLTAGDRQFGKKFFSNENNESAYKSRAEIDGVPFQSATRLNHKSGVIKTYDQLRFKRTIFRITKGNCLVVTVKFEDIFQNLIEGQIQKVVFFVLYPVRADSYFSRKLNKLISNFSDKSSDVIQKGVSSFESKVRDFELSYQEAYSLRELCKGELDTFLQSRLMETVENKLNFLNLKKHEYLKLYLLKQKHLYSVQNQFEAREHFFQGEVFVKRQQIKQAQDTLNLKQLQRSSSALPGGYIISSKSNSVEKYPSSFSTNTFTKPAQQIVQTYGVPRYKQVNPSYFTTVTFPFLFGVMFGDIAHGSIILAFGCFLMLKKQQLQNNQILKVLLPYRYLISLMGFFAVYCGFIYNDFMSISLNLFGSCYSLQQVNQGSEIPRKSVECVYSIGIDPVWAVAENTLNFTNSLKMKISVIIGVAHMMLGVFLKASNQIYFRQFKELVFEFVPQIAFLVAMFGYMDFLIIYKWLVEWGTPEFDTARAPSIISQMIAIPLAMGSTEGKPLWDQESQEGLQFTLLIIAALAVPLMLLPVPIMKILALKRKSPRKGKKKSRISQNSQNRMDSIIQNSINSQLLQELDRLSAQKLDSEEQNDRPGSHDEQQEASQIFVHQIIETIEYVLGSVSNTASYLRLWALSLAHSQLSEVFFEKTIESSIASGWPGIFMNVIGFAMLAGITVGIMLCMDSMECFLHTLRLHWVEFQNKFYKADGVAFKTFSFYDKINEELRIQNY